MDGTGTSRDPYLCQSDSATEEELNIPVVDMRSYKMRAVIACNRTSFRFSCDSRINVSLQGITFVNTSLHFVECSLKMVDCSFVEEFDTGLSLSFALNSTADIYLNGCSFQNNSASSLKISGNHVRLNISNSLFATNKLHNVNDTIFAMSTTDLQAPQISGFTVNFSNVTVSQNSCPGNACFEIVAGVNGKLTIEMDQVSFGNNQAGENILDVHGSSNAYIEFKSTNFRGNAGRAINLHDGNSLKLKITKATFNENEIGERRNGGALSVSGFTKEAFVSLSRSDFISNKAAENGGACAFNDILLLILDIESCQFVQNEAWVSGGALSVGSNYRWQVNAVVDIRSSHFSDNILHFLLFDTCIRYKECSIQSGDNWPADVGGGGALALYVLNMRRLSLVNSTFVNNTAQEKNSGAIRAQLGTLYMDAIVLNCEFIRNSGASLSSTIQLTISNPLWTFRPRVTIRHCKFLENKGSTNSIYDIYLFPSYLVMSSCTLVKNSGGGIFYGTYSNTSNILVENSLLRDNLNFAFYIYTDPNMISYGSRYQFKNVSFINNNCQTWSSIFRISMYPSQSVLFFQASTFLNNYCKAGVVKISVLPSSQWKPVTGPENAWVTFNNSEFRGNSGVAESAVTIFDVKTIDIQNANFTNNFGSTDGSHLRVQMRSSKLTIYKTNFYQSRESLVFNTYREQPYNGFLTVTSFGNISIRESSFVSDPFSVDGEALLFVKGAHKVVMNDSVRVKSPFSTKLHLHNFTHHEYVSDYVQSLIVSFSLSTESCPMGTYSLKRGSSEGFIIENHVKCLACPTGGNCTSALSARHNFWGYPIGDKVYFKFCPQGYCCPPVNQRCPYHNSSYLYSGCQGNRTGFLCGRCKEGFSDTLFTTNCVLVKHCTHYWYLIIIFICTSLFALFLVHQPPVFEILMKNLTWFLPRRKRTVSGDYHNLDSDAKNTDNGASSGYLKILFYFYQIAGVLTASSYGVREVLKDNIVLPLVSLLDFKISVRNDWSICPFPGINPLEKTLFQLVAVIAIFLSIPVTFLLHSGLNKLRKRTPALPPCGPYLSATVEIVLLGYSAATGTAMKLLNCVQIQHVSRWYYDAEITCFQWWQNASFAGIALFLFPFIFALYFASLQLYQGQISAKIFLLACVFPLPYLLLLFVSYLNKVIAQRRDFTEMVAPSSVADHDEDDKSTFPSSTIEHAVLEVLTAPFCKPQDNHSTGKVYWESVLIGRRFLLILIGSFLEHAFLRSVCLTIFCLVFLLHHVYQKPFVKFWANLVETVSLATLVAIAILNVGVTSYYSVGIEAGGLQQQYIWFFHLTEAVLLGCAPFLFVVVVILSLVSQLVRLAIILIQATRWLIFKSKTRNHRPQLGQAQPLLVPES